MAEESDVGTVLNLYIHSGKQKKPSYEIEMEYWKLNRWPFT